MSRKSLAEVIAESILIQFQESGSVSELFIDWNEDRLANLPTKISQLLKTSNTQVHPVKNTTKQLQASISTLIQSEIDMDTSLIEELKAFAQRISSPKARKKQVVENSKNIVQDSKIQSDGNIHIGDESYTQQINNHGKIGHQININENKGDIHL